MSYSALRLQGDVVQLIRTVRYGSLHQGTRPALTTRPEFTARSRAREAGSVAVGLDSESDRSAGQRIHPNEVRPWREYAREGSAAVFDERPGDGIERPAQALHADTGRLAVE